MKTLSTIFIIVFTFIVNVSANNNETYWKQANRCYKAQHFDSAALLYQQILKTQPENANVYYNLGNAYYKSNNISLSILNFERSIFYSPSFEKAFDNLVLAKSRIPKAIKPIPDIFFLRWWKFITNGNMVNFWALSSLILFLSFIGLIGFGMQTKTIKSYPFQIFILIPSLILTLLLLAFKANKNHNHSILAVVITTNTPMRNGPNTSNEKTLIPEGTTVETEESDGTWIAVTLPDKRSGWIQKSNLAFVHSASKK